MYRKFQKKNEGSDFTFVSQTCSTAQNTSHVKSTQKKFFSPESGNTIRASMPTTVHAGRAVFDHLRAHQEGLVQVRAVPVLELTDVDVHDVASCRGRNPKNIMLSSGKCEVWRKPNAVPGPGEYNVVPRSNCPQVFF
jgi:hypothetical protein